MVNPEVKTSKKRPVKPFRGAVDGTPFTPINQPTPEQKKAGWQELRAQRLLTQAILAKMAEGNNLKEYIESLVKNAKKGNAKAIETVNKGIEDDVLKIEQQTKVSLNGGIVIEWPEAD